MKHISLSFYSLLVDYMASHDPLGMMRKWDDLQKSLNSLGDQLSIRGSEFPDVNHFSSDSDFRDLVNALTMIRTEINALARDIDVQSGNLGVDMKYYHDLARDYEEEINTFRKGRDQAFQLYDKLSEQHRELLREHETLKANISYDRDECMNAKQGQASAEEQLRIMKEANDALTEDLSTFRINLASARKRVEILEEENEQLSSVQNHGDKDRNELIDQLAKEIKSRNDALVLADAARNELSRLLGEAEKDRMARDAAEKERDEVAASVNDLQSVIEELKQAVDEETKLVKHETLMRHKVEEQLLSREDELKQLSETLASRDLELEEIRATLAQAQEHEATWKEEKENYASQIGILAQQMAADKLENKQLMDTLKKVQIDFDKAKTASDDSVEKTKQLERIINQFIEDKGTLEKTITQLEAEKAKIIEDSKDVVELRARLENTIKSLETQLNETKHLFDQERKLKEESTLALKKAELIVSKHDEQMTKVSEQLVVITKERDELKTTLDGVQKVLQSERAARTQLEHSHETAAAELNKLRSMVQQEQQLKTQALNSLEAESRSKQEAIKQLEESRKTEDKAKSGSDKLKAELDAAKDKLKEEERAKKDLAKQIEDLKKDLTKASTETEKTIRIKEELARKADAEGALHKEMEKGWNSEKSEHEKTYKAYMDEKAKRDQAEAELGTLKAQVNEAQRAVEAERVEHSKTFKAYESEKGSRTSIEAELAKLQSALAEAKSSAQSLAAEKQAADKRIAKLEQTISEVTEAKDSVAKDAASLASARKQLEQAEKIKAELAGERQKRTETEEKLKQLKDEDEQLRIRTNNVALENEKLVKRITRLEAELEAEKRVKAELVDAIKKKVDNQVD